MKIVNLILAVGIGLSSIAHAEFSGEWDQQQFLEKQQKSNLLVLDVRSKEEFAQGHVPGAINIPHDQLDKQLEQLSEHKNSEIVLYCRSGRRAGAAEAYLSSQGFKKLYHLKGDMIGWNEAGLKVSK